MSGRERKKGRNKWDEKNIENCAASKVGRRQRFLVQALVFTEFALPCSGVYGGGGSGATGGAVQDARPHVLSGAQAAPHEQD